jgi:hypothetical protein
MRPLPSHWWDQVRHNKGRQNHSNGWLGELSIRVNNHGEEIEQHAGTVNTEGLGVSSICVVCSEWCTLGKAQNKRDVQVRSAPRGPVSRQCLSGNGVRTVVVVFLGCAHGE